MDRRRRFREYIAAFNITDPRKAFEAGQYVTQPGGSVSERLRARIEIHPSAIQFVIGGVGVGKTTQLLAAKQALDGVEDLVVRYVDVARIHNLAKLQPSLLLTLAGLELSALVAEPYSKEIRTGIRAIAEHAHGGWTDPDDDDDDRPGGWGYSVWQTGVLQDPMPVDGRVASIESHVRELLGTLGDKKLVVFFDGLDRSHSPAALLDLLRQDLRAMKRLGLGAVLVAPERMLFGAARGFLDHFEWQPATAIDARHSEEGATFLIDVLRKRAAPELLPDHVAARIVGMSGGVLRDLIALARSAGEEAYVSGSDEITTEHVDVAADRFGRKQIFGLGSEDLKALKRVDKTHDFVETSDHDVALLVTGRVLQYARPQSRFEVHPALAPLVRKLDWAA